MTLLAPLAPEHVAALVDVPRDHLLVVHGGRLGLALAGPSSYRELAARNALDVHRPLVDDDATYEFVVPFSPGVTLSSFIDAQAQQGGRLDEELARAVVERVALLAMTLHRRTTRRAGELDDTRVWLGFDGDVALTGPFARLDEERRARDVWLDVRRIGPMAAALLGGVRADASAAPWGLEMLTWDGDVPTLSPRATRIIETALDATGHGAASTLWHVTRDGPRLDEGVARARLAAVVRGLFPHAHARAERAIEEAALFA